VLKSRFRFHGGHIGALFLAFFAIGGILKLFIDPYTTKGEPVGSFFVIVLIILWPIFLYSIYDVLKIPKIIFESGGIVFKTIFSTRIISLNEIASINLTGKKEIAATLNSEEISTLNLSTGEKIFIRTECYKNSPEIRQTLEKLISVLGGEKKIIDISLVAKKESEPEKQSYSDQENLWNLKFSGNPFFNLNAILFFGFAAGLFLATKNTIRLYPERLPILIIPVVAFYLGLGFQLHYFILSDNHLIIKNHFWFWKKHIYPVKDIREVVFESPHRTSNSLRLITKGFKSKIYPAGSLRTGHWKKLKQLLLEKKIDIRDEIGFD
jgi:hypothetical protein